MHYVEYFTYNILRSSFQFSFYLSALSNSMMFLIWDSTCPPLLIRFNDAMVFIGMPVGLYLKKKLSKRLSRMTHNQKFRRKYTTRRQITPPWNLRNCKTSLPNPKTIMRVKYQRYQLLRRKTKQPKRSCLKRILIVRQ